MFRNSCLKRAAILVCLLIILVILYFIPPIHDRLSWRLDNLRAKVIYALKPPENVVFVPEDISATALSSAGLLDETRSPTPLPTKTQAPLQNTTPSPTPTASPVPTAIPAQVTLNGVVHEYQKWNNCGPANLAMLLSFWGWQGTQVDTAALLKPNPRDNNVMPGEMLTFITEQTDLKAIMRYGGDLVLLKRLIAAGFPVLVEKGLIHDNGWMGHYQALTGYDDERGVFIAQDSLIIPNLPVPYEQMEKDWRVFANVYLVAYPAGRESLLKDVLGDRWDENVSIRLAEKIMMEDTTRLKGRDLAFAWFSLGTSYTLTKQYPEAASAYDKYFVLYSTLPKENRPWRMVWYQNGPYEAYYYTGRYKDVVSLASITLSALTERLLEEACYWRALAKEKLGDTEGAVIDLQQALERNPLYTPARVELERLQNSGQTQ